MNRRRFVFWLGFGMFSVGAKLRIDCLDEWAAAAMRSTDVPAAPATSPTAAADPATPIHWIATGDQHWQWYEREHFVDGRWQLTGTTAPVHRQTGKRKADRADYLDDTQVPADVRHAAKTESTGGSQHNATPAAEERLDFSQHQPSAARKARHGRPPSKWLRSLHADEIRIWLNSIEVPEAGVSGMTYWTHLTRDHSFDPLKIDGLTIPEQAKLHAAAHFGY